MPHAVARFRLLVRFFRGSINIAIASWIFGGAFAFAVPCAAEANATDPRQQAEALYVRGVNEQGYAVYSQSVPEHIQHLNAAESLFKQAITLRAEYFDALIHLANVQAELQKFADSLRNLETAYAIAGISELDKLRTQQAIAYVKSQLGSAATPPPRSSVRPAGKEAEQIIKQAALPPAAVTSPTGSETDEPDARQPEVAEMAQQSPRIEQLETAQQTQAVQPTQTIQNVAPPAVPNSPPLSPATVGVNWTKWVDPTERAFSLEIPAGWSAEGGMTRVSAIDVRPWIRVTSPDKLISAFVGDGAISPSTMPTAQLTSLGFPVGSKYMTGLILPYIPARQFAEKYAFLKLKPHVQDLQVVQEGYHPDVAQIVNGNNSTRSDCASIKLTCTAGSLPAVAYYIAATRANVTSGTGMWWVTLLAGEISPAQLEPVGLQVLIHMLQSFQYDSQWYSQSQQTTAAVSQNYRANANIISKSISDRYWSQQAFNDRMNQSYWKNQAVRDNAANNFSDYMRGQENVTDPQTGNVYKVPQAAQHWIDPGGNITGGDNTFAPGPDWRQLQTGP